MILPAEDNTLVEMISRDIDKPFLAGKYMITKWFSKEQYEQMKKEPDWQEEKGHAPYWFPDIQQMIDNYIKKEETKELQAEIEKEIERRENKEVDETLLSADTKMSKLITVMTMYIDEIEIVYDFEICVDADGRFFKYTCERSGVGCGDWEREYLEFISPSELKETLDSWEKEMEELKDEYALGLEYTEIMGDGPSMDRLGDFRKKEKRDSDDDNDLPL